MVPRDETEQGGGETSAIEARLLTGADDAEWERGLAQSREGTWLQWLPWLRLAAGRLGRCEVVGLVRAGRIIGGVAGLVRDEAGGPVFRNVPLTAYHGLWLTDQGLSPSRLDSLMTSAAAALVPFLDGQYASWAFSSAPELFDPRPWRERGCGTEVYMTYRLPLDSAEAIAERLESNARRRVRRAEKAGARFEVCAPTARDLDDFEANARDTAERHGLLAQGYPDHLSRDIAELAIGGGRAQLFIARMADGRSAASVLCVWDTFRAYTFLGGNASGGMKDGQPRFLDHHVHLWLAEHGHREVDLLGGNLPSLRAYKKQTNAAAVPYLTVTGGRAPRLSRGAHLRAAARHLLQAVRG